MRLALFGGTFDPIHTGHLAIARQAGESLELGKVLFVPAARPPHKAGVTFAPYEDRVRMAEIACRDDSCFEVSRLEEHTVRSYSIDTIEKVRAGIAPDDELYFIIGADAFAEITTWRRWQDVVRAVRFIVVSRPGHKYDVPSGVKVDRLDTVDIPVSSSDIRQALASGERPTALPSGVFDYIVEHRLYQVRVNA